jgi:hypothetical protein
LHLGGLPLGDASGSIFLALQQLEELNVAGTHITSPAIAAIVALPKLRSLALNQLRLSDDDAAVIATQKSLNTVTLDDATITVAGITAIATLPRLENLSLAGTSFSDAACNQLATTARQLVSINVSATNVTTRCILQLSNIATLKELHADDLALRAQELTFSPTSAIEVLSLDGPAMNDRAVPALLALPRLTTLYVRKEAFSLSRIRELSATGLALTHR